MSLVKAAQTFIACAVRRTLTQSDVEPLNKHWPENVEKRRKVYFLLSEFLLPLKKINRRTAVDFFTKSFTPIVFRL